MANKTILYKIFQLNYKCIGLYNKFHTINNIEKKNNFNQLAMDHVNLEYFGKLQVVLEYSMQGPIIST